ncbi:hypothetical protein O7632_29925 [Solwaraspora sp. WMMD406]|uniref:hypothetical protein n=1 Tax=Solwaraspora sp. WMMD406 TaxID=3016095 RepID=UPI002416C64D|nr:hypothetical protein [Solwaraspora sp. WMMD406]MDG4768277.1 hypothetical protein [Solwaraspora sp. WMMD406]
MAFPQEHGALVVVGYGPAGLARARFSGVIVQSGAARQEYDEQSDGGERGMALS